jgi:hypothetical protein
MASESLIFEKFIVTARGSREICLPNWPGCVRPRGGSRVSAVDLVQPLDMSAR